MLSPPIELTEEGDGGGEGPSDLKIPDAAPPSDNSDGEASASSTESVKNQSSLGQFDAGDGEGEGFRTPDRKIPPVTDCPPAPKKARPSNPIGKRKASSPRRCRIFGPDVSTSQLETMFPPAQVKREDEDGDASRRKSKKAREEDDSE